MPRIALIFTNLFFVFFFPNYLGHFDNYIPGNPLITPAHIVPEWYLLPFYAILRAIPDKTLGVLAMILSILSLLTLPIFNNIYISSTKFRPLQKLNVIYFFLIFLLLI